MRRGRPTIGGTPREKRVTVRLTAQEEETLTRLHGSPGKGIRFLVAAMMRMDKTPVAGMSASPGGEKEKGVPRPEERGPDLNPIEVDIKRARAQGISEEALGRIQEAQEKDPRREPGVMVDLGVQEDLMGDTTLPPEEEAARHSNSKAEVLKAVAAGTHRHKPVGEPIRIEYVQGVEKKVYACACGKEMKR